MRGPGLTLALLSVLAVLTTLPMGSATAAAPSAGVTVSLSATPSYGTGPLLVQFSTSVATGTPTVYNWSFGDATFLNASGPAAGDPSHLYEQPASYNAEVTVHEGSAFGSASIYIHVFSAPLTVSVSATPLTGVAPLTVTFRGSVSGGTGTYVSLNWSFGDGGVGAGSLVQYTYSRPGRFDATLTVVDTNGSEQEGAVWINVTADSAASTSGVTGSGALDWALLGFGLGVGLILVVFTIRSRLTGWHSSPSGSPPPSVTGPLPPQPQEPASAAPAPTSTAPTSGEVLRTSQRVLVHLAGQGIPGAYDVARPGLTQAGMGAALGVRQNGLTNVLRRLTDAGLLESELRHVQGQPRRLKVYWLTPRGQILARELRQRRTSQNGK
jgi:PKD repeat protein